MMIRDIIEAEIQKPKSWKSSSNNFRLRPSEAGSCSRMVAYRKRGVVGKPFPLKVVESMSNGDAFEESTFNILSGFYGDRLQTQVELKTDKWSGRLDFVIDHQTPDVIIVEHKAVGDKWWDYKGSLPKTSHVVQVALYKGLYAQVYGFVPKLILYYRSWGNWAEFDVEPLETEILISGRISGDKDGIKTRETRIPINIESLIGHLEWIVDKDKMPPLPKPEQMNDIGCTFQGKPSCSFFEHCYPNQKHVSDLD